MGIAAMLNKIRTISKPGYTDGDVKGIRTALAPATIKLIERVLRLPMMSKTKPDIRTIII